MDPDLLTSALRSPDAWPDRPAEVEFLETHISRLYFVGERVYKVKKEIVLPFLDYGTLERRRRFCEEEVRLNERLARGVYLRVAPIARSESGKIALDGEGEVVEWAVEMVRLPAERMLDAKLDRGEVDSELVRDLARVLSEFHSRARTGPGVDEHASYAAVQRNVRDNFVELFEHVDRGARVVSERLHAHLSNAAERFMSESRALFDRRVAEGRARDGHGDLHAGNVCVTPRGIVAYDCIEFSDRFRCSDVACDLAFLAMDLDGRGYRAFSQALFKSYAQCARDPEIEELADFYKGYRAIVRAKVAAVHAAGAGGIEARAESMRYVQLAASYTLPPMLVLTCGLPASGKSWAASAVARPFEAVSASSDVRRKVLARVRLESHRTEGLDAGLYAPELKQRTYQSLLDSARVALEKGRTIVVDATFPDRARRAPFRELARSLGVPFVLVHATVDDAIARERLEARARDPHSVSDANLAVYERAKQTFEPPDELFANERVDHRSATESAEDLTAHLIDRVLEQLAVAPQLPSPSPNCSEGIRRPVSPDV